MTKSPNGHAIIGVVGMNLVESKPIDWLWPNRLARGKLTMLAGHGGKGKSQIYTSFAATLSRGLPWPDGQSCNHPGSTIILNAEDGPEDTIKPRLLAAGADCSKVFLARDYIPEAQSSLKPRLPNLAMDLTLLEKTLAEITDLRLIVLDPLMSFTGRGDSAKESEVRAILSPFCMMLERLNIACLGLMHFNKKTDVEQALMRILGSVAFSALPRMIYVAGNPNDDEDTHEFALAKSNIGPFPMPALTYRMEPITLPDGIQTCRIAWGAEAVSRADDVVKHRSRYQKADVSRATQYITDQLRDAAQRAQDLFDHASELGISERSLRNAAKELHVQLKREGFGGPVWWSLPVEQEQ